MSEDTMRHIVLNEERMFVDGCTPESLRESTLLPFYKKGDKDDPSNYRGIALMQTIAKLYDRLLLQRLRAVINQFLRPNQNGFRPDRSTTQHILALRILLDHAHTYKDFATVLTFVDFSKAFDSVTWKAIRLALEAWQVQSINQCHKYRKSSRPCSPSWSSTSSSSAPTTATPTCLK